MVSLSSSSRLPIKSSAMVVNPVTFPPGRARLSTNPIYSRHLVGDSRLLDHPIRAEQHRLRNRYADLLGGFEIDHEIVLRWAFDWQIRGFGAFENLVDEYRGTPIGFCWYRTVRDETAGVRPTVDWKCALPEAVFAVQRD